MNQFKRLLCGGFGVALVVFFVWLTLAFITCHVKGGPTPQPGSTPLPTPTPEATIDETPIK